MFNIVQLLENGQKTRAKNALWEKIAALATAQKPLGDIKAEEKPIGPKPLTGDTEAPKPNPIAAKPVVTGPDPVKDQSSQPVRSSVASKPAEQSHFTSIPNNRLAKPFSKMARNTGIVDVDGNTYVNSADVELLGKLGFEIVGYGELEKTSEALDLYSYVEKVAGVPKAVARAVDKGESFSGSFLKDMEYNVPKGYEVKGDLCCPIEKTAELSKEALGNRAARRIAAMLERLPQNSESRENVINTLINYKGVRNRNIPENLLKRTPEGKLYQAHNTGKAVPERIAQVPAAHSGAFDIVKRREVSDIPQENFKERMHLNELEFNNSLKAKYLEEQVSRNARRPDKFPIAADKLEKMKKELMLRKRYTDPYEQTTINETLSNEIGHSTDRRHTLPRTLANHQNATLEDIANTFGPRLGATSAQPLERLFQAVKRRSLDSGQQLSDNPKGILRSYDVSKNVTDPLFTPHLTSVDHDYRKNLLENPKLHGTNQEWAKDPLYETVVSPANAKRPRLSSNATYVPASPNDTSAVSIESLPADKSMIYKGGRVGSLRAAERLQNDRPYFFTGKPEIGSGYAFSNPDITHVKPVSNLTELLAYFKQNRPNPKARKEIKDFHNKSILKSAAADPQANEKPGLWANIRAKRARGEKAAKPGDEDYPDKEQWKKLSKAASSLSALKKLIRQLRSSGVTVTKDPKGYAKIILGRLKKELPGHGTNLSEMTSHIKEGLPPSYNGVDRVVYIPRKPPESITSQSRAGKLLDKNYRMSDSIMHEGGHALHHLEDPGLHLRQLAENPHAFPSESLALERIANNNAINFMRDSNVPENMIENYKQNFAKPGHGTYRKFMGWNKASKTSPAYSVENPTISSNQIDKLYVPAQDIRDAAIKRYMGKQANEKPGLWANIRAKKARGERAAKPGDEAYPDKTQWNKLTKESAADPSQTILVTGHSGAGKSTLAKALAEKLNLPLHRVDAQTSWDDLREHFEKNPELERRALTPGSAEHKQYIKDVRKIVRKSLGEIDGPAVLEGTQVTTLSPKQLAKYKASILVGGDVEQSIAQRLQRSADKAAKKGVTFTPEELAKKKEESKFVADSWHPGMEKFKKIPGVINYNHTEHKLEPLIERLRTMMNKQAVAAWQRSEGKNPEGGLNAKGRASYKKETGGTLKAPVTESDPSGERASRQHSFCARMCGMKSKNTGSKGQSDPDSRINKSLRKWNCKCGEDHGSLFEKVACLVKESKGRCWEGYKPVPGKEPYSNDSCEPVGAKKKKEEKKAAADIPLKSSNIKAVGYDKKDKTLEVKFHNGGEYKYNKVPKALYRRLLKAKSPGKFLHKHIKKDNKYSYERVEKD